MTMPPDDYISGHSGTTEPPASFKEVLFFTIVNTSIIVLVWMISTLLDSGVSGFLDPSAWWVMPLKVLVVVVVGLALFLLKLYRQLYYGCVELAFACLSIYYTLNLFQSNSSYSAAIPVVAAAYLIVRGLDNIRSGWKLEKSYTTEISNPESREETF